MAASGWLVEGLNPSQYQSLRKSNPARYQKIRTRALQSARLRIPGVRADMKTATSRGEQVIRDKGGVPNFHSYKAEEQGIFVKPDGFIGARTDQDMKEICDRLNNTPRKCLGWRTPAEVFREKLLQELR